MTTAFTPQAKNHAGLGPTASRVVRANELEWEPIKYPGCYVKTLMVDRKSGLLTVLLKMDAGASLPDYMLAPFLLVARAARDGCEAPSDAMLAQVYGTHSLGRVRRLIAYMEEQGIFVLRTDLSGKRSITIPRLGWTTTAALPEAAE